MHGLDEFKLLKAGRETNMLHVHSITLTYTNYMAEKRRHLSNRSFHLSILPSP